MPACRPPAPHIRPPNRNGRKRMDRSWMKFAAAAACLLLFGAHPAEAADTVKIGIIWPLTGNAAAAGQASKAAAEVAADIVNNAQPELGDLPLAKTAGLPNLGGAKLELVFADHPATPSLDQQLLPRPLPLRTAPSLVASARSSSGCAP